MANRKQTRTQKKDITKEMAMAFVCLRMSAKSLLSECESDATDAAAAAKSHLFHLPKNATIKTDLFLAAAVIAMTCLGRVNKRQTKQQHQQHKKDNYYFKIQQNAANSPLFKYQLEFEPLLRRRLNHCHWCYSQTAKLAIINFNNEKIQLFRPRDRQADRRAGRQANCLLILLYDTKKMHWKFIDFTPGICVFFALAFSS